MGVPFKPPPLNRLQSGSSSQLNGKDTGVGPGKGLMAAREFAIHHTLHKTEPEQAGTEQGLYLDNILHYVAEF